MKTPNQPASLIEYNVQLFDHSLGAKLKDVLKDGIPRKKLGRIEHLIVVMEVEE